MELGWDNYTHTLKMDKHTHIHTQADKQTNRPDTDNLLLVGQMEGAKVVALNSASVGAMEPLGTASRGPVVKAAIKLGHLKPRPNHERDDTYIKLKYSFQLSMFT